MEMFHLKLQSLETLKTLPSNEDIQTIPIPIKLNKLFNHQNQQQVLLEKQQTHKSQSFYDTNCSIIFKLILLITIDWYIFVLGLSIAFYRQIDNSANITMYVIIIVIFVVDIILNSYQRQDTYQTKKITTFIKNNVQQIIDIVTTIPIILYVAYPNEITLYLQSLFIFKLYKRRQYKKRIFYKLSSHRILRGIFITFYLLIDVLVVTHYLAAFYILMDEKLKNSYDSDHFFWMSNNDTYEFDITNSVWYVKYLYAQFFSLGTWTLIAPGPTPKNPVQVAYTNFAMVFFIIVASKIVKQIIEMIDEDGDQDAPEPVISEQKIQQFMNGKKIGNQTKNKILIYTKFLCQTKQKHSNALLQIKRLPISLQAEISSQFWDISKLTWLKQLDNDYLLKKMLDIMDERLVQFGEYIVNQGQNLQIYLLKCSPKSFLFFSQFGSLKQYSIELKMNEQDLLFQQQFLTDQPISVSVMALKTSTITIINKIIFIEIVKNEQLLYQSFCQIKDQIFSNKRRLNKCYFCNFQHRNKACTQMFYGESVRQQYWIQQNSRTLVQRKKLHTKIRWFNKKVNKLSPLFKRTDSITQYDNIHIDTPYSMINYYPKYNIY